MDAQGEARHDSLAKKLREYARPVMHGEHAVLGQMILEALKLLAVLPFVVLMRIIAPLRLIRIGAIRAERIGHFAIEPELYLCRKDLGLESRTSSDIFFFTLPVCNEQLAQMWVRTLRVFQPLEWVHRANRLLPGGAQHALDMARNWSRDTESLLARTTPHLNFTAEESSLGEKELAELGVPAGAQFICFLARDSFYLAETLPDREWDYHRYRDVNISSYLPALEEMTRRRHFALRMGAKVENVLSSDNPMIIDYASRSRSAFMDIYLLSRCRFYLEDKAGLWAVAALFRKPAAYANIVPLDEAPTWSPQDLFIPKKIWARRDNRFLTFSEILGSKVGQLGLANDYEERDLECVDNAPEEITALALEMEARLSGTWETTEADEELQHRFRSLFISRERHGPILARMGAQFLRDNRFLLD